MAFHYLLQGVFCVGAALAYHVGQDAMAVVGESGEVTMVDEGRPAQVPNSTASHNSSSAQPSKTAAEHADSVAHSSAHSSAQPSKPAAPAPHHEAPLKHAAKSGNAAKGTSKHHTSSAQLGHDDKEAHRSLDLVEHQLDKGKAAMEKATEAFQAAQAVEKEAKKARSQALKDLRKAKEKRAADYKRVKSGKTGHADVLKADDVAIRKAEHAYEMSMARWQRAKDEVQKKGQGIKPASESVRKLEVAKMHAEQSVKDIEFKERAAEKLERQATIEMQRTKAKKAQILHKKNALIAQFKTARRERLSSKKMTPKERQAMKSREVHLAHTLHKVSKQAKELKPHKPRARKSHQSAPKHGKEH